MRSAGRPPEVIGVVGPTATGKSDLGVALALELDGEVVGADASQLYRGMDIGTAKLAYAARGGVPHHQIDVLGVRDEASVAAYQRAARADLDGIGDRGRTALLVGGSGLYVRAALDRLEIPPTDPAVRARLTDDLQRVGVAALRERLAAVDPQAAASIEPQNDRRIVRALEVIELTGRPFSATLPTRDFVRPTIVIGLRAPRDLLDGRVEARVARMWAEGLLDEVRELSACGLREGRTASRAVGYAQALGQLDGRISEVEAQHETTRLTRRLVRRQESWFGADPRIHWFDAEAPDLLAQATALVRRGIPDNG